MLRHLIAMVFGTLVLAAGLFCCWPAQAAGPYGKLAVDNARIAHVTVLADGRQLGRLGPESEGVFRLRAGEHELLAKLDDGRTALRERVRVAPGRQTRVVVPPYEGRLTVANQTGRPARLWLDKEDRGLLAAGAERSYVLDPGPCTVQLKEGARLLDSGSASVTRGGGSRYVAEAPRVADVRLRNVQPLKLKLEVGAQAAVTLDIGETRVLEGVAVGSVPVAVFDGRGRLLRSDVIEVLPYDGARYVVPAPENAPLRLVNLSSEPADVLSDGQRVAKMKGGQQLTLMLPLGERELTMKHRSSGKLVRTTVEVEPFEQVTLRFDARRHYVTQDEKLLTALEELLAALKRLAG